MSTGQLSPEPRCRNHARPEIRITEDALRDLKEIHAFLWDEVSPTVAYHWLNHILSVIAERVSAQTDKVAAPPPSPASYPDELGALGIREYREIRLKTYRILYRMHGDCAYIYLVTDGRRDMQSLLSQRFLMG